MNSNSSKAFLWVRIRKRSFENTASKFWSEVRNPSARISEKSQSAFSFSDNSRHQHFAPEMRKQFLEVHVEKNLLKVWKISAQGHKNSWRSFFSRYFFLEKLLDTYNTNSRGLLECFFPMSEKFWPNRTENNEITFLSKNFLPWTFFFELIKGVSSNHTKNVSLKVRHLHNPLKKPKENYWKSSINVGCGFEKTAESFHSK